jgi:RNA polymerase sigma-70 factor (ECF subfamily)
LDGRRPPVALGPEVRYEATESMALGFVAALQHLPPRQRCVLVLRDVLGLPPEEVASMLDTTEGSVKGVLQRARATLRSRLADGGLTTMPLPRSPSSRAVVDRFVTAVEAGDIDSVVALLAEDAWVTMPPEPYEYQGRDAVVRFLLDRAQRRGANLRLVATSANGQPAFGCYLPDAHTPMAHAYGLLVLTLRGDEIGALTWFSDRSILATFGLSRTVDTVSD